MSFLLEKGADLNATNNYGDDVIQLRLFTMDLRL